MNYQSIHDAIIMRAKSTKYDSKLHQLHHVIPRHEDPNSVEVVPLTMKEHRLVHKLRWKFNESVGNLHAYRLMGGVLTVEQHRLIAIKGGLKGGATTKGMGLGIFNESWDRSAETKRRWKEGIINRETIVDSMLRDDRASKMGRKVADNKLGIFSPEWDRSESNRKYWRSLSPEEKEIRNLLMGNVAGLGGLTSKEKKAGIHSLTPEQQRINASKGGKAMKGRQCYTNGVINIKIKKDEAPPIDFWPGMTRRKESK